MKVNDLIKGMVYRHKVYRPIPGMETCPVVFIRETKDGYLFENGYGHTGMLNRLSVEEDILDIDEYESEWFEKGSVVPV